MVGAASCSYFLLSVRGADVGVRASSVTIRCKAYGLIIGSIRGVAEHKLKSDRFEPAFSACC
jgi:hypothetical protein